MSEPKVYLLREEDLRFKGHLRDADRIPKISLLVRIKRFIRKLLNDNYMEKYHRAFFKAVLEQFKIDSVAIIRDGREDYVSINNKKPVKLEDFYPEIKDKKCQK